MPESLLVFSGDVAVLFGDGKAITFEVPDVPDTDPPVVTGVPTINEAGTTLTVVFNEPVWVLSNQGNILVTTSGSFMNMTTRPVTGNGTNTLVWSLPRLVAFHESVYLGFSSSQLQDGAGNTIENLGVKLIRNNSVVGLPFPSAANVRDGIAIGDGNNGTLKVPTASQTLLNVQVDAGVGNVVLPTINNVVEGVSYGPNAGLTGTAETGGGGNENGLEVGKVYRWTNVGHGTNYDLVKIEEHEEE